MARVTYGGGITNFAGSIAGTTFQKTRSGNIARTRTTRPSRTTEKMAETQLSTFDLLRLWRELTFTNQLAWNSFAALHTRIDPYGRTTILSGYNWFISINSNRLLCGTAAAVTPPTYTLPTPPDSLFLQADADLLSITYEMHATPVNTKLVILTTPAFIGTKTSYVPLLRLTEVITPLIDDEHYITASWSLTHSIPFRPSNPCAFSLGSAIYSIEKTSGITSPAQLSSHQWTP
jgi:hypothetical protein